MNSELTRGINYFGKLPGRGDFVKSPRNNNRLITALDGWAEQALTALAEDVDWKSRYDHGQPLDFALLGSRRASAVAGHLYPAQDASGRRFPFITAVSVETPRPLAFMSRSPLAFSRTWALLGRNSRELYGQPEPLPMLRALAETRVNVNVLHDSLNPGFQDFLETQTIQDLQQLLETRPECVSVRRILFALGVLLQPVMSAGSSGMGKGLILPLPSDALYCNLVATLWLDLITRFLDRAEFELLIMIRRSSPGSLAVGFNGLQARQLQAMFDPTVAESDYVYLSDPEWVEPHVNADLGLQKLSTYTRARDLTLRTAHNTFRETFLGT